MNTLEIVTAGLASGGYSTTAIGDTESWNGTNWTELNNLNTARYSSAGSGTQTAAVVFGGAPGFIAKTEDWNGSNWAERADLSTARYGGSGTPAGTSSAAFYAVGRYNSTTDTAATEEWSGTSSSNNTISTS